MIYRWKSSRDASKTYIVQLTRNGHGTCTCPGFRHHGHCKHITSAQAGDFSEATDITPSFRKTRQGDVIMTGLNVPE